MKALDLSALNEALSRAKWAKDSKTVRRLVLEVAPRILLSFSRGKDSLATWLACREEGFDIVPFYLSVVPGLEFVEESLRYYERIFGCRIMQFPQQELYLKLNKLVFQPPEMQRVVDACGLPIYTRDDHQASAAEDAGMDPRSVVTAVGIRVSDNMIRRMAYKKNGAVNLKRRTFWPVFDWSNEDVRAALRKHNVKLPIDYKLFGRSMDGMNIRYVWPIKKRFPRDYERIKEFYPLLDLELLRYEWQRPSPQTHLA